MQVYHTIADIRNFVADCRSTGKTVGLVPTMGYFHAGHLSLMQAAHRRCDVVVVSIFVNPMQFGPREDLAQYPRDLQRDCGLAREVGVDAIFAPTDQEMYPHGFSTHVEVNGITDCLCGLARPGHFRGVATVVTKLFNIVAPQMAFFGQKDAQQALVIQRLVEDLNMPLEIVILPTVREEDGLAMSSRNVYLDAGQRSRATVLYQSLHNFAAAVDQGERDVARLRQDMVDLINATPGAEMEYVEILSVPYLTPVQQIQGRCLAAVAVRFGSTRLIDNIMVEVKDNDDHTV